MRNFCLIVESLNRGILESWNCEIVESLRLPHTNIQLSTFRLRLVNNDRKKNKDLPIINV